MPNDKWNHQLEIWRIKARTHFKQLARYLSLAAIVFGAWTMYSESDVVKMSDGDSKILQAIPNQTLIELGYFDGVFVLGIGIVALVILSR